MKKYIHMGSIVLYHRYKSCIICLKYPITYLSSLMQVSKLVKEDTFLKKLVQFINHNRIHPGTSRAYVTFQILQEQTYESSFVSASEWCFPNHGKYDHNLFSSYFLVTPKLPICYQYYHKRSKQGKQDQKRTLLCFQDNKLITSVHRSMHHKGHKMKYTNIELT